MKGRGREGWASLHSNLHCVFSLGAGKGIPALSAVNRHQWDMASKGTLLGMGNNKAWGQPSAFSLPHLSGRKAQHLSVDPRSIQDDRELGVVCDILIVASCIPHAAEGILVPTVQALQTVLWSLQAMGKQGTGVQHSSRLGTPWCEVTGIFAQREPY